MAESLWDRTQGTNIGDMVNNGGLAAAFDGNLSQSNATSAIKANAGPTGGYVGKDFGSGNAKPISRVVVRTTNNIGFTNSGTATLTLFGKNSAPSSPSDGTSLGSNSIGSAGSNSTDYTVNSSDTSTAYRYVWARVAGSNAGADAYCCELSIYYISSTTYNQTVSASRSCVVSVVKRAARTVAAPSTTATSLNKGRFIVVSAAIAATVSVTTARVISALVAVACSSAVALSRSIYTNVSVVAATTVSVTRLAARQLTVACSSSAAIFRRTAATVVVGCATLSDVAKQCLKGVYATSLTFVALLLRYWLQRPEQQESWSQQTTPQEHWVERSSDTEQWEERVSNPDIWTEKPKSNEPWS